MRRDSYDEQLDDAELAAIYPRHVPQAPVLKPAIRFHLARREDRLLSNVSGPYTRHYATEQLRDMVADGSGSDLCVVEWWGQWSDAEVVLTAEECVS